MNDVSLNLSKNYNVNTIGHAQNHQFDLIYEWNEKAIPPGKRQRGQRRLL